jgi:hypothetical protein
VFSFFARDEKWVEGTPGADGFPVSTLKFPPLKADGKWKGWGLGPVIEGVSHVRVNFWIKNKNPITTDGTNWGVKIFGTAKGQDALQACEIDKWCWISVTGAATFGDEGHILLSADDVTSAFEADIKQLTCEAFGKEIQPLPKPRTTTPSTSEE